MTGRLASLALSLLMLPALAAAQPEPQPGWFVDAATGCKAWDSTPTLGESISWTGDCENGLAQGQGVLQWLENGKPTARYEGMYQAGKMNGHGVFRMANGDQYEGEFKDDAFNGHGIYSWANGDRYDGLWSDDKPNGQGSKTNSKGEVFSGVWVNGCFKQGDRRAVAYTTAKECGFE